MLVLLGTTGMINFQLICLTRVLLDKIFIKTDYVDLHDFSRIFFACWLISKFNPCQKYPTTANFQKESKHNWLLGTNLIYSAS